LTDKLESAKAYAGMDSVHTESHGEFGNEAGHSYEREIPLRAPDSMMPEEDVAEGDIWKEEIRDFEPPRDEEGKLTEEGKMRHAESKLIERVTNNRVRVKQID
jgi:hypothetical protein